ncbi:MAG: hypothetical protein IT435_07430 [Phycisphaerales bacterium]|nr:hypothetical protein [Phycisphaerales bacterium]
MPINWKAMYSDPAISEAAIPELFERLGPIFGRQVTIELRPAGQRETPGRAVADFVVSVAWGTERYEFAAEAKMRNTPRVLDEALRQARRWAADSGRLPMVVVPFLGEKRIERLEEEGISGLDLCGNGLILVQGRLLLRRTGQPNRYPESRPARFAYRGATSLVPRVFLRRAEYSSVGQVRDEIEAAGGTVALSTVSKALARMADDLIVDRSEGRIALVQPDKLLDALVENFAAPKPERTAQLKTPLHLEDFFRRAQEVVGSAPKLQMVLSGASAQGRYAGGLRADVPVVYANNLNELKRRIGDAWKPVDRFANLTVVETRDPTPFFDARRDDGGASFASPVQAYLELAAGGDKRDTEMAQQVRARILRDLVR